MCTMLDQILSCFGKCRQTQTQTENINVTCAPKFNNCCSTSEENKLPEIAIKYSDDILLFYNIDFKYFTIYRKDLLTGNTFELRADNIHGVLSYLYQNELSRGVSSQV